MQTTKAKKVSGEKEYKPLISNEMIGSLINLSGRQRMLSQRIILNVLLTIHGNRETLNVAEEALELFKRTHTLLVQGDYEHPGIFCEELHKAFYGDNRSNDNINTFIDHAEQAIQSVKQDNRNAQSQVNTLSEMASDIVTHLNAITAVYETQAKKRVAMRNKQQRELMQNMQKIAKEARIVSFNAQVIAARAGESGREFSVVAGVLTNITEEMDNLTLAAMDNTES